MIYRLYLRDASSMLANLERHPSVLMTDFASISLHVVLKDPARDLGEYKVVVDQAANLGIEVMPGFRLMEQPTATFADWFDPARWLLKASWLRAIVGVVGEGHPVGIDIESYYTAEPKVLTAASVAHDPASTRKFADSFAPFAHAIKETRTIPCVLRATVDDLPTAAIVEAAGGGELWPEIVPNLPTLVRTDPLAAEMMVRELARVSTRMKQRWRGIWVRHMADDHILRTWGALMRSRLVDYGELEPWLYDESGRDAKDNDRIGTPAWVSGATRSSTNDVAHCWRFPPFSAGAVLGTPGGVAMKPTWFTPPPYRADVRSMLGVLLTGGLVYSSSAKVAPKADFSVAVGCVLPAVGHGPIVGACQPNSGSWQIVLDEAGRVVLDLRHVGRPPSTHVLIEKPMRGVPMRLCISRRSEVWGHGAGSVLSPHPVAPVAGYLWVGAGTTAANVQTRFDGLVVSSVEIGARGLSTEERAAVEARSWPR